MIVSLLIGSAFAQDLETLPQTTEASTEEVRPRRPPYRPPPHRPPPRPARPAEPDTQVSLSMSAIHLAVPMAEFSGEFRIAPRASLGLIGGLGSYEEIPRFDVGLQARGYVSGDFDRGVGLGLEARYTNLGVLSRDDNAVAFGPFLAAKYTFDMPLTVDAQLGVALVNAESYVAVAPIARLGIGWSF